MFVELFKALKRRDVLPDFSSVIDPDSLDNEEIAKTKSVDVNVPTNFGISSGTWTVIEFHKHPGLRLIRNPFTALGQRYWTARCLRDYHQPPNKTNLSNLGKGIADWWQDLRSTTTRDEHLKLRNSLRWVTLGYHHNWDTKVYSEEDFTPFPADLNLLISTVIAPALGYKDFQSQAAIVNYYPQGSTLSGHTDHSEINLDAPLFSISFGQSAIFLIGGPERSDAATPILLQSGDILVMSKESRLCFHAVPRILNGCEEKWNDLEDRKDSTFPEDDLWSSCCKSAFWKSFNEYLKDCRINLNVRQVLNKDQVQAGSY